LADRRVESSALDTVMPSTYSQVPLPSQGRIKISPSPPRRRLWLSVAQPCGLHGRRLQTHQD
jgi:hypothetical protein